MDPLHPETEKNHLQRDWSELSPNLLHLISRKLPDLFDFVRFRIVCKQWRAAARSTNHHPLLPCLLGRNFDHFLLYCLSSGETHKINLTDPENRINGPKLGDWNFAGPMGHHILAGTVNSVYLYLINPLTKKTVFLPPLNHICFSGQWEALNATGKLEHVAVCGFEEDYSSQHLALYQHSDGKWLTIKKDLSGRYPITCYKGMYYCLINETGITEVIEATRGEIMSKIPPPETGIAYTSYYEQHFVKSTGDLFLVFKFRRISHPKFSIEYHFKIYRLNQENGDPRWVKVSTIADQSFFLGISRGFSIRTTDFDRFKGNCIYWIDSVFVPVKDSFPAPAIPVTYLMRYDMEDCRMEQLPYPFDGAVTWIMPSLQ